MTAQLAEQRRCDDGGTSTEALASAVLVQPASIRRRYSKTGSYFGVVPEKLANNRLRWPSDASNRLMKRRGKP
jgi:hypothetical protein